MLKIILELEEERVPDSNAEGWKVAVDKVQEVKGII